MPAKRKPHIPPVRASADGTGFQRVDETGPTRGNLARLAPPTSASRAPGAASASDHHGRQDHRSGRAPVRRTNIPNADGDTTDTSEFSSTSSSCSPPRKQVTDTSLTDRGRGPARRMPAVAATAQKAVHDTVKATSTQATDSQVQPPTPSPLPTQAATKAAGVSLALAVDHSLLSCEVKLSPARCRQLGVRSGALVHVGPSPDETTLVAEVTLSTSQAADSVALNNDAASLFENRQVFVRALPLAADALPVVRRLTVDVSQPHLEDNGLLPSAGSVSQWSALFRRHYQHRIAYTGMRTTLRLFAHNVEMEVGQVTLSPSSASPLSTALTFGVLTDATTIDVVFAPSHTAVSDSRAGTQPSSVPSIDRLCGHMANRAGHILVVGGAGTGKTHQLEQIASRAKHEGRHVVALRAEEIAQGETSEVHSAAVVAEMFSQAKHITPCLICVDDLDLLCGSTTGSSVGSHWAMTLVATAVCEQLRDIARRRLDVRVVASAESPTTLHPTLLAPDYLGGSIVTLTPPASAQTRTTCFEACLRALLGEAAWEAMTVDSRVALTGAVADAHGYTQRDLHRVAQAALLGHFETHGNVKLADDDVRKALKLVRPSALRQFEVSVPDITWHDIGGSAEAKRTLQEVVAWCLGKQSWLFTEFNITPPKGVLLYGPPGCSKTMLAKALANESRMNFVSVKGPEIFSKWVGDSEKAIRDIFARARAASPCVVFIDELDGMCGHRGRGGVSDRVVSQFLTELDGLPAAFASEKAALVFVAATNRPDSIDEAVLRPGRIDRLVYVGLPDREERAAIAAIQLTKLPVAPELTPDYVADRTEGYTGAEVVAVVKESAFIAVANSLEAAFISSQDVDAALKKVLPRIAPKEVAWYRQWAHGKH